MVANPHSPRGVRVSGCPLQGFASRERILEGGFMKRPLFLLLVAAAVIIPADRYAQSSRATAAAGEPSVPPAAAATDGVAAGTADPDLDAVRAATERYRDVQVALAEGYITDPAGTCESAEMMGQSTEEGAMGIHYFRPDLLGITAVEPRVDGTGIHTDFLQPSVLIYEPQADGSLELVAVENLVFKAAWAAAGNTMPPSYLGVEWDSMEDDPSTVVDEAHHFAPHYDRHVWLYRENPKGVFAQFNPNATCRHKPAQPHAH
jgi:hypothetical protein